MTALPPPIEPSAKYTEAESARLLGVHRHTLARWREDGTMVPLPPVPGCPRVYFSGRELLRAWRNH